MNYPKFQYSYFLENGAQVVVRGEEWGEFVMDVTKAKTEYPVKLSTAANLADEARAKAVERPVSSDSVTGEWCDGHHVPMKLNKNGKPYHMDRSRPEGKQFCNGYGFPDEKRP